MNSWMKIEEFCALVNLDIAAVQALIDEGKLISKEDEEGVCFVEVSRSAQALIPATKGVVLDEIYEGGAVSMSSEFVEKPVGAILRMRPLRGNANQRTPSWRSAAGVKSLVVAVKPKSYACFSSFFMPMTR